MKTTIILVLFGLILTSCASSNSQKKRKTFVESQPAQIDKDTHYVRDTFGSNR